MSYDYLIVHKKILPDHLEKVIYARNLLRDNKVKTITEAVAKAGISRNTYYKYRDYVFSVEEKMAARHAVLSLVLKDESGTLAEVINRVSSSSASVITISQAMPLAGKADILMTLDITDMYCAMEELLKKIKKIKNVISVRLNGWD